MPKRAWRGTAGIFFSVPASAEFITREQYEKFMRPLDLEFLQAIAWKGECHVLHAHGEKLYIDRLLDYPVQVISWADINDRANRPRVNPGVSMEKDIRRMWANYAHLYRGTADLIYRTDTGKGIAKEVEDPSAGSVK